MKNLNICFSNFKYCLPTIAPPPPSPNSHHHRRRSPPPSSSSSLLVKNFNSLFDLSDVVHLTAAAPIFSSDDNITSTTATTTTAAPATTNSSSDDDRPDFSAAFASKRFFVSSPGESNSIVESLPNSPKTKSNGGNNTVAGGGVAIQTYSPDPYADFRRSMQEMLEAHKSKSKSKSSSDESDLDYLEELLKCYLSLNPKRNHKLIVRAFSDLVVSLLIL